MQIKTTVEYIHIHSNKSWQGFQEKGVLIFRWWQRKWSSYTLVVGMQTSTATKENSMEAHQETKSRPAIDPVIPFLSTHPEEIAVFIRDTCTNALISTLSTTANKWN
jgi:hypothetical protein